MNFETPETKKGPEAEIEQKPIFTKEGALIVPGKGGEIPPEEIQEILEEMNIKERPNVVISLPEGMTKDINPEELAQELSQTMKKNKVFNIAAWLKKKMEGPGEKQE